VSLCLSGKKGEKMSHPHPLILSLVIIIASIFTTAQAKSVYTGIDPDSYGIRTGNLQYANITKQDVGVIYSAKSLETSTMLTYSSYIFTTEDIVLFSYEDGTRLEVYDSGGNPVAVAPNILNKGEHVYLNTSMGVYFVAGSNKFAVLTGDATTAGTSGYYAMDANGRGASREFYTYAPALGGHCEFIVFAYENGTNITIQQEITNGIYADIASFTLDKGKHWANSGLSAKYLHIIADKPISALTCYDQSYFVPSANGLWNGTEFYTYLSDIEGWSEDLTVISYDGNTFASIKDSNTQELIWEGTLDSGQAHVQSYPDGANKYFTITSSKPVTVSAQPWVAMTSNYYQGTFVPDKLGTGVGIDIIGTTLNGGYLYILAHMDNTQVDVYNSTTGALQAHYVLNMGQFVNANPGNGLWRIKSDKEISAYSGFGYTAQASFVPLIFNEATYLALEIVDDVNDGDCVLPGREINYTITYDSNGIGDSNVILIDYLPVEVDYNSSSPEGDYDPTARTVTWNIGTVPPEGNGTFLLKVDVNNFAEPCTVFTNASRIAGDTMCCSAKVNTSVCAWNPEVIYVDCNRVGGKNNGMSWQDAYTDLQKALDRASIGDGSQIWVAKGIYNPSIQDPCILNGLLTFKLINGIPLYGHFAGNETSIIQRDFNDANNETTLKKGTGYVYRVITASGLSQNNILDGFTITGANNDAGIKIANAYLKILNCLITNNSAYGINAINSAFTVIDCNIQNSSVGINTDFGNNGTLPETRIVNSIIRNNNTYDGIYLYRANSLITVQNCSIYNNYRGISVWASSLPSTITGCKIFSNNPVGIMTSNSSSGDIILDNWIYCNGGYGILLSSYPGATIIRNNTIVSNNSYGIYLLSGTTAPVINNCIVWGHNDDLYSCSATYSCIKNNDSGTGNIHTDPCFVNVDANDFHLRPESLCIDAGDPCFMDFNETDIDGECRIMFGKSAIRADIGADELDWPKADFDRNKIVNFIDYAIWAPAWKTTDPNKSLDLDNDVDIDDLSQFCDDWLWQAPW
jgi:hypothetical protein